MMMKNKSFVIRLSKEQFDFVNDLVQQTGISRESYVRTLLSGYYPKAIPSKEFWQVLSELRTIGNNMNQIAVVANKTGLISAKEYAKNYNEVVKQISIIREIISKPIPLEVD